MTIPSETVGFAAIAPAPMLAPLSAIEGDLTQHVVTEPPAPNLIAHNGSPIEAGCTAPQLRRFIKSRAYVPMHELRRRFNLNGAEDEVSQLDVDGSRIYIGLPVRESRLMGELLRQGDVGYELSVDPVSPIVIGVYPMRPVPRV
jgi:hypothetical protein